MAVIPSRCATKLSQPDASFDVVVCTQVAEYIADVDAVLSEAFRVSKAGRANNLPMQPPRLLRRCRKTSECIGKLEAYAAFAGPIGG
jgi:ubiquinone/menaquinone biosynthesis C-methylase UbiE